MNVHPYFQVSDDEPINSDVCEPIKTYEELFDVAKDPPNWYYRTNEIVTRAYRVIDNRLFGCHLFLPSPVSFPERLEKHKVPRTILCHDMKNGYLQDKYCDDVPIGNGYTFNYWQNIDMFIYFSHHFITIPPLQWINVAHKHGVQMMGTIITEWADGEVLCNKFLKDEEEVDNFVFALSKITYALKLDGWLINIENKIAGDKVEMLVKFVDKLTRIVHKTVRNGVVIWYDSVINSGELKWQNELNDLNKCFFDVCDGIFLNYTWTEANLGKSVVSAEGRPFDVYVGIDVFGRNTPYAAGSDCHRGVQSARDLDLSVAIFAPGWTYETTEPDPFDTFFYRFIMNDQRFWATLWPYLYTHPISHPFHTEFNLGASEGGFQLQDQEIQLTNTACCFQCLIYQGHCYYQIFKNPLTTTNLTWHHLLATEIDMDGAYWLVLHTANIKTDDYQFHLILVIQKESGEIENMVCGVRDREDAKVDEPVKSSKRFYFANFAEKAQLLHIYALLPYAFEVALSGLTLMRQTFPVAN